MQIDSSHVVAAPIDAVWNLLMDATAIAGCLPGCQELRALGDDRYEAEIVISLAAVTGRYAATVTIDQRQPPTSYRLAVEGTGRPGFVKGQALVTLATREEGTIVTVTASAEVGGLIARVGQRLLDGVARTMMQRFFACLAARLSAVPPGGSALPS